MRTMWRKKEHHLRRWFDSDNNENDNNAYENVIDINMTTATTMKQPTTKSADDDDDDDNDDDLGFFFSAIWPPFFPFGCPQGTEWKKVRSVLRRLSRPSLALGKIKAGTRKWRQKYGRTVGQIREKHNINSHLIIHFPTSERVSEASESANKWKQRSVQAKRAGRSKQTSERCDRMS